MNSLNRNKIKIVIYLTFIILISQICSINSKMISSNTNTNTNSLNSKNNNNIYSELNILKSINNNNLNTSFLSSSTFVPVKYASKNNKSAKNAHNNNNNNNSEESSNTNNKNTNNDYSFSATMHKSFKKFNIKDFLTAIFTLFISGFGDKSFFITTLMAIKYGKWLVLFTASFALSVMGIFSVFMGIEIQKTVPSYIIDIVAISLFVLTGIHMIYEGYVMKDDMELNDFKLEEDKEYLPVNSNNNNTNSKENTAHNSDNPIYIKDTSDEESKDHKLGFGYNYGFEQENIQDNTNNIYNSKNNNKEYDQISHLSSITKLHTYNNSYNVKVLAVAFSNIFVLVFCSELGDRSQISTIYLTKQHDPIILFIAAVIANIILTSFSVVFGKLIAEFFSIRKLTIFAGIMFVLYALIVGFCALEDHGVIKTISFTSLFSGIGSSFNDDKEKVK